MEFFVLLQIPGCILCLSRRPPVILVCFVSTRWHHSFSTPSASGSFLQIFTLMWKFKSDSIRRSSPKTNCFTNWMIFFPPQKQDDMKWLLTNQQRRHSGSVLYLRSRLGSRKPNLNKNYRIYSVDVSNSSPLCLKSQHFLCKFKRLWKWTWVMCSVLSAALNYCFPWERETDYCLAVCDGLLITPWLPAYK